MKFTLLFQLSFFFILSFSSVIASESDIEIIRARVIAELNKSDTDDGHVQKILSTMRPDGTWPNINYSDVSREGFEHRFHLENMIEMARAYRSRASKFHNKRKLKEAIELSLTYWVTQDFICDNWWHNQIGTPNSLVKLNLIMDEKLAKELVLQTQPMINRAVVTATGARPGGDRIKIAGIQAKNLLYFRDAEKFGEIVKVIEREIKFVDWIGNEYGYGFHKIQSGLGTSDPNGRGMQFDHSFHHRTDGVNNTISYGLGYANAFIEWVVYTANTSYSFSDKKLEHLVDYYLDGICKTTVFGKFPDPGAKNRSISRKGTLKPYTAGSAERLLRATNYRKDELQEIADIRNGRAKPSLSHATYYWQSDHFTFQRPHFFTSVRMYSTRLHNMEWPYNSEGLLNHHRGDGTNHISVSGREYYDIAPVFDYQKIPGATILQKEQLPSPEEVQKLGLTDFVGAVTDGKYGAATFDFQSPHDRLIARKSWFFFDEEYVCLGAGISSKTELPVVTTLNQCLLVDDVLISDENTQRKIEEGESTYDNVNWIYHDQVGYIFPRPQTVNIENNEAVGSWWRINKQSDSPKEEVKKDVFKLWIDHGASPKNESYGYIVVPATNVEKVSNGISKNRIDILSNTPELQAVMNNESGICQMVFYESGKLLLEQGLEVACHGPAIVMLKKMGNSITEISASDPSRKMSEVHLTISGKILSEGDGYHVQWNANNNTSNIHIELPKNQYAGSSTTITF